MDYYGIGFSNIRLPNNPNSIAYEFDPRYNTFPEEVFVHEFLHTFERNMEEYGYTVPELHDNLVYGYKEDSKDGLRKWYSDYMQGKILDEKTNKYIGLSNDIYYKKPVNSENFIYSLEIEFNKEPTNPIQRFVTLLQTITKSKVRIEQ